MTESPVVRAKAAMADMDEHEAAGDAARARRDTAIHDIADGEGLRPPEIARQLGLSPSLIRWVLSRPRPGTRAGKSRASRA